MTTFMDASNQGWGAHLGYCHIAVTWFARTETSTSIAWSWRRFLWLDKTGLSCCQAPGFDCDWPYHGILPRQQAGGGDMFPFLASSDSTPIFLITQPQHSVKGQTQNWLTQCDRRRVVLAGSPSEHGWSLHPAVPISGIQPVGNPNSRYSSPVCVSDSRGQSTGSGFTCFKHGNWNRSTSHVSSSLAREGLECCCTSVLSFGAKNQKPTHVNDSWYIPTIPTGKHQFSRPTPNCPIRALRYFFHFMRENPGLRKANAGYLSLLRIITTVRN